MMGINLLETVRQKLPFTEDEARELLIEAVHRINENWPSGALLASKGTSLYIEYQRATDTLDEAFFGTREQFLKALQSYEVIMMKIADNYRQGK
ncbi:MAG: hypothetical protein GX236_03890 [Clostridiaceae bacterium]|nr:hypothetical protein [Clostridiaceae bacterium]